MSPAHFREFILPHLREMVQAAKSRGVPFIKHANGNLRTLLDDLIGTGLDAMDLLERIAGMDIGEVKSRHGRSNALAGNVDCGELLCRGSVEEVVEAVGRTSEVRLAKRCAGR